MTTLSLPASASPITVTVTRRASADRDREVLAWLQAGTSLAERSPGFLGAGWLRPSAGSQDWHILYRFASPDDLAVWEGSRERSWWLASGQGLVSEHRQERRTGIEGWFDAPATYDVVTRQPPR
jgi:antibiotic biosynthesis monooxygenase (ABM) superfamily enzyme